MRTKIYFLISILFIIIIVLTNIFVNSENIYITGKAIRIIPEENLIYEGFNKSIPIKGVNVIAVSGKIMAYPNLATIPVSDIKNPISYSISNDKGVFRFNLLPGEYTFFLIFKDKAYLNDFDGNGNFSSIQIDTRKDDLILTDYRYSLY
tara:strand:+ start:304 stop:750 length:447 start_codon:yes stop_codon:yes gene_type:complete